MTEYGCNSLQKRATNCNFSAPTSTRQKYTLLQKLLHECAWRHWQSASQCWQWSNRGSPVWKQCWPMLVCCAQWIFHSLNCNDLLEVFYQIIEFAVAISRKNAKWLPICLWCSFFILVKCQAWGNDHANLTTSLKFVLRCHFQTQPKDIRESL